MFAFLPLVALLSAFGLSTKHATPKPSPIVSMSPWIAYHADGSFSSNPPLGTCLMDSARIPAGMYSFACRTEDGDTVLLSHRDTDEKTEALYTLFYMDADVPTVAYGSVNWSSGLTVWTLESDEPRLSESDVDSMENLPTVPAAPSTVRPLSGLPSPAIVQVATRGNVAEPARATTCYLDLDCPE